LKIWTEFLSVGIIYPFKSHQAFRWTIQAICQAGLLLAALLIPMTHALARPVDQQGAPEGPVYIVQEGDSLWSIAVRFGISMTDLAAANGIADPNQLAVGDQLVIPGLKGIQGVLTTQTVPYGESLASLSRQHHVPLETLIRLNHLTSPAELYAGSELVIPLDNQAATGSRRDVLAPGQSLLELAASRGASPWSYVLSNDLAGSWNALPGEVLHLPQSAPEQAVTGPGGLPEAIRSVTLSPTPNVQGKAAVIEVNGEDGLSLGGSLIDHPLHFFPTQAGGYASIQGIHAMTEPGLYPLVISGTLSSGAPFAFSQAVLVGDGSYPFDPVLTVSAETIDPAVTRPEDAQWAALTAAATPEKLWQGIFQSPAPPPYQDCWPSLFGNRRSYNGSAYIYYHTGLDFCGGVGTEILAPAAGRVVFAGPLTVRGNATIIDHGWGVYSGYLHQSEILVKAGDMVQPGQVIGKVGGTGRVTGPHLHWEVWAGGVQVDPMDWLENSILP
jgi:murein DD-endopeptidase MepM/ murein hydrolase activator NlpD